MRENNLTLLVAEYTNRAGTETYLLQLLNLFSKFEKNLLLLTVGGSPEDIVSKTVRDLGFQHVRIEVGRTDSVVSQIEKLFGQPLSRLFKTNTFEKVVVSAGTPGFLADFLRFSHSRFYILHTYPHGTRQRVLGRYLARSFPKNTKIICVSKYSKIQIRKLWGSRLGVVVVPNGVPIPKDSSPEISNEKLVLTLGSVEDYKNPELWLDIALSYHSVNAGAQTRFEWVGEGSQIELLRSKVPNELRDQIVFTGSVSDPRDYYRRATIYLQPSKVESFGLSVAEALSYGIPCVVSQSGGMPEVVNEECAVVVATNDVSEYVSALNSLLGDSELRSNMSKNAISHHAEELSIGIWQQRIAEVLEL